MTTLQERLAAAAKFGAEYGDQNSNHLPMALIALDRLGADDATMTRFAEQYATKLVPKAPPKTRLTRESWKSHLGKHAHHTDHVELIDGHWGSIGKDELLRRYVPLLLGGVGAAAFHGMIRLAYGLDADSRTEIVEGLAHWSDSYLAIARDRLRPAHPPTKVAESLARVAADGSLKAPSGTSGPIYKAMAAAAAQPAFGTHIWTLAVDADPFVTLGDIAAAALKIYASTKSFTALHLVTSAHALRLVLPWADDQALAVQRYWHAFVAAYVTIGKPEPRDIAPESNVPAWSEIKARVATSRDDHAIKLVYTCMEEAKVYPALPYQQVAAGRVGGKRD